MSDDARLRIVQVVLRWAWDPIGVRGVIEAADEYDMYASAVLAMLRSSASDQLLADYLTSVVRDRVELAPNREADRDIACMLRELYASTC